jgi:hypothetical protein
MSSLSATHFGYVIAYVLPGFVALWGLRPLSPTVSDWLSTSPSFPAGIEAIAFVSITSIGAGMTVSAARWFFVDSMHAMTGVRRPIWNDATLNDRLPAFESLVDAHFRYYQFHANMAVALAFAFTVAVFMDALPAGSFAGWTAAFVALESLLLITSRDNLRHYYRRVSLLLGYARRKEVNHVERSRQTKAAARK